MNGVLKFFGGDSSGQVDPTSPRSNLSASPPALAPIETNTSPLVVAAKGPSWPPPSPTELSPEGSLPPVGSPPKSTTTAALFFRKDKQRPVPTPSSTDDGHRPTNPRSPPPSRSPMPFGIASPASSAGPSSPNARPVPPSLASQISRKSTGTVNGVENGNGSSRDLLLMSLLSSEAVVDSRDYEVLDAEEVEELKKEYQVLSARLMAATKKVKLETKIRDAAVSLSKVNASYKKMSKQTSEQLEAAERKVEAAQLELWRVSERANEVNRRLLEHRAGVLSFSVRVLEKKGHPLVNNLGRGTPEGVAAMSTPLSPVSSITSASLSSKPRFEGPHLFAGHADAISPQAPRPPVSDADISGLEERLKAATDALAAASKKQAEMGRELSMLRLEKEQVETTLGMELQGAEDHVAALEEEVSALRSKDEQLQKLLAEKQEWEETRAWLEQNGAELEAARMLLEADLGRTRKALEDMEARGADASETEAQLQRVREEGRQQMEEAQRKMQEAQKQWELDRAQWQTEKAEQEQAHAAQLTQIKDENNRARMQDKEDLQETESQLEETFEALRAMVQTHGIVLTSRDSSLLGLAESIGDHLVDLSEKMSNHARSIQEWEASRKKLQDDIQLGLDKRQELVREAEEARREREEARREARLFETQLRDQAGALSSSPATTLRSLPPDPTYSEDVSRVFAILEPIWAILPSPEARASKMGQQRHFRAGSQPVTGNRVGSPTSPQVGPSLSDADVRSLKTLYDPASANVRTPATPMGAFSVEAFAQRVQALVADDRALIERLIRFAQAHDLLKKNAERAQKLAQETNVALETYQKQVKMLEDRNMSLLETQAALEDEMHNMQLLVERASAEKREIEASAAEQAESLKHLSEVNDSLSARTLGLAQEAATAGDSARKEMEIQLADCKASLARAEEEIGVMQVRSMQLLEELNSLQTENNNLRNQLRARQ